MINKRAVSVLAPVVVSVALTLSACGSSSSSSAALSTSQSTSGNSTSSTAKDATTTSTTPHKAAGAKVAPQPAGKVVAGCENVTLDNATRTALVKAFGNKGGSIENDGGNYYGKCGKDYYALASVTPPANISDDDAVSYQDQPITFSNLGGSGWEATGDTGGSGCYFPESNIPKALFTSVWGFPSCE